MRRQGEVDGGGVQAEALGWGMARRDNDSGPVCLHRALPSCPEP